MRYSPVVYAKALAEALGKRISPQDGQKISRNFLHLVRQNGDEQQLKKIIAQAEKLVLRQSGRRRVLMESARLLNQNQREALHKTLKRGDVVEEKVSPELIAGVKITLDDELQFDGSLARKLNKMFA